MLNKLNWQTVCRLTIKYLFMRAKMINLLFINKRKMINLLFINKRKMINLLFINKRKMIN